MFLKLRSIWTNTCWLFLMLNWDSSFSSLPSNSVSFFCINFMFCSLLLIFGTVSKRDRRGIRASCWLHTLFKWLSITSNLFCKPRFALLLIIGLLLVDVCWTFNSWWEPGESRGMVRFWNDCYEVPGDAALLVPVLVLIFALKSLFY